MLRDIAGPTGRLEALLDLPRPFDASNTDLGTAVSRTSVRAAVVIGHPHPQFGGTMHTKAVHHAAKALARIGCAVLRFNFRGVGRSEGSFDAGIGEQDDFRAAVDFVTSTYPDVPVWAAGMSFGSWVGLSVGATDPRVSGLIGIAVPLSRYDFTTIGDSQKAKFFIHGERDDITSLNEVRAFYARAAEPKELVVIDGADHVFDGKVSEVGDALEDLLADWPEVDGHAWRA